MNTISMESIGLSEQLKQEASFYENLYIGRVSSQHKDLYKVISEKGEFQAKVSGKLRFYNDEITDYPAVGDWVMVDRLSDENGTAIIHHTLTRKSIFERKAAGTSNENQIVATNINIIFICMSLNNDFNLRRLERYLAVAWESNATPIVILTKADLCDDLNLKLAEIASVAIGIDVVTTSFKDSKGFETIQSYLTNGVTAACIGSSGVGKSTLINHLLGEKILLTSEVREDDDRGRHTTTHRQLFTLPNGGVIIDTPGMRELQLDGADLSSTFSDIEKLAEKCRFNDCSHNKEPYCAVKEAIDTGYLPIERFNSYKKLLKELKYQELKSSQREREKINNMFGSKNGMKQMKKHVKMTNKLR